MFSGTAWEVGEAEKGGGGLHMEEVILFFAWSRSRSLACAVMVAAAPKNPEPSARA